MKYPQGTYYWNETYSWIILDSLTFMIVKDPHKDFPNAIHTCTSKVKLNELINAWDKKTNHIFV